MRLLVFDCETSGLPERFAKINQLSKWPYIVQLSFLIYDDQENKIIKKRNNYIKLNEDIKINKISESIHKISKYKLDQEGIDIKDILNDLNSLLLECDLIIGHNLNFDKNMFIVECERNKIKNSFDIIKKNNNINEYCTMKNSINLCKLENPYYPDSYKFPKLSELYFHLFNENPENLHNSWFDVLITFKCFYKIYFDKELNLLELDIE